MPRHIYQMWLSVINIVEMGGMWKMPKGPRVNIHHGSITTQDLTVI